LLSLLTEMSGVMARICRQFRDGCRPHREKRGEKAPGVATPGVAGYRG
jgi:hypothetical protein